MPYPLKSGKPAWQYKLVQNFLGGIDTQKRPDELADNQVVAIENLIAKQGRVTNDTGYVKIGQKLVGDAQLEYKFQHQDASIETVVVTTKTVYTYDYGLKFWRLVKGTTSTTVSAGVGPGSIAVAVASVAGFVIGDLIGVDLSDGGQHQTAIQNIVSSTITFVDAVPAGKNILTSAALVRAVALSGDLDHPISADTYAANSWMVFTNGVDKPQRYDGTDCVVVPNLPSGGNIICQVVIVYNAALFLLNTTESGVELPQRARRSDQGDPTNWTTGTSGTDDLLDSSDAITGAKRQGPYLIVYRQKTIARGQFVGASGLNYFFETAVGGKEGGDGALGPIAILEMKDHNVVLGQNNIYQYYGDYTITPFGDQIFYRVWAEGGNLNPSIRHRSFLTYVPELDEIWLMYPTGNSTTGCDGVLRYSRKYNCWYSRVFPNSFYSSALFQAQNIVTWAESVGTWAQQKGAWDRQVNTQQPFNVHLCGNDSQVYAYDYQAVLDNGSPIQYTLETKDYIFPDKEIRHDMLEMYVRGDAVQVGYSVDSGRTWNALGTINQPYEDKVQMFGQFVCHKIRYRFTGSGPFALDWIGFSYKDESITAYSEISQ